MADTKFQFHTVQFEVVKPDKSQIIKGLFQFHTVQFEVSAQQSRRGYCYLVSIPHGSIRRLKQPAIIDFLEVFQFHKVQFEGDILKGKEAIFG